MIAIPKSLDIFSSIKKEDICIPKIVHLTYKSYDSIPKVWENTIVSWRKLHPEWKIMFWGDKDNHNFIKEKYPWFLDIYNNYQYNIQRVDAVRYFILYTYGGVYCDLDLEPIKPFDDLFINDKPVHLVKSPNGQCITNGIMASKPGSKFWESVFDKLKDTFYNPKIWWIGKHLRVMYTTGPLMLHSVWDSYLAKNEINLLPTELVMPSRCNVCSEKPCSVPLGYTKTLEGSSWIVMDTKIYLSVICNYKNVIVGLVIACFIIIAILYNKYPDNIYDGVF